ncbi:MAG: phosphatase PAP2 family protein [Cyclobacteriaceae bacterium]
MIRTCILLVFLLQTLVLNAQEKARPFNISTKKDLPILAVGASGLILASVLNSSIKPLTEEQIASLDPSQINAFDRPAVDQYNGRKENISDLLLGVSILTPLSLFADKNIRHDAAPIAVMLSEVAMLNVGVTSSFKGGFKRIRPYVYNPDIPLSKKTNKKSRHAYFSGHVSNAASLSFFTASVVSKYSQNPTVKTLVWTGAILLPAATGYLRYKSGKHYPTDVITGYMVGASIGYLIPKLHESKTNKSKTGGLSYAISPGHVSFTYKF